MGLLVVTLALAGTACGDDAVGGGGSGGAGSGGATSQGSTGGGTSDASTSQSSSSAPGGGGPGGEGGGAVELTCTLDDRPPLELCPEDADDTNDIEDCVVESEAGGCPNTTVTWRCTPGEGGNHWEREIDRHCDCSAVVDDEEACGTLPGCVWARPGVEECGDDPYDASPVPAEGCYRTDCGNAYWDLYGEVGGSCDYDLCTTDDG